MPFDIESVRARLPDRRIEWFRSIGSSMPEAARLAAEGCPSGTVVGADEQTAGIGRHGHSWHSEADSGLYVSIVLRLNQGARTLPVVMLALAVAVREAIAQSSGLAADLRWPNDLLIGDKKCAGILALLHDDAVVAGIGVNVNHAAFPPPIDQTATSLRLTTGRPHSREDLLVELLGAIDRLCTILGQEGPPAILSMFEHASSYARGRRVRVEQDGAEIIGTTSGLDSSGFLIVKEDQGKEIRVLAGGVRALTPDTSHLCS